MTELEAYNILGIKVKDPFMPGTLYLTEDGSLTKDASKAMKVKTMQLTKPIGRIMSYSKRFFIREVPTP